MNKLLGHCLALWFFMQVTLGLPSSRRLVCYYNSNSLPELDFARMKLSELEIALPYCTHLVYGYAGLSNESYEISSLSDIDASHYRMVTAMKGRYPQLKIYLSLGGDHDTNDTDDSKYIQFLEGGLQNYNKFIQSSLALVKSNGFDGLDLAFQFPRNKPRKYHSVVGKALKGIKELFTCCDDVVDADAQAHKNQFTQFVEEIQRAYATENLALTLTVLPNVNSSWYFDIPKIQHKFEYINLFAFDFVTPERNPYEADYTAPIYFKDEQDRLPYNNIEFQVQHWIVNGCAAGKLNLGMAMYGHAWKTTKSSGSSGLPVVAATVGRAALVRANLRWPGLLRWIDICTQQFARGSAVYRGLTCKALKVVDNERKYGNYAFCPADDKNEYGTWISYDDPDFAAVKAGYVREKGLGGMALYDITYDDFRGLCSGDRYPILYSVKKNLM